MSDRPTPRGLGGRADLLLALAEGDEALLAATAEILGYRKTIQPAAESKKTADDVAVQVEPGPSNRPAPDVAIPPLAPATFWRVEEYVSRDELAPEADTRHEEGRTLPRSVRNPGPQPTIRLLAPWPELRKRLRPLLSRLRSGNEADYERVVGQLSRGRLLQRLPMRQHRRLVARLLLVFDRSERLVPYWTDQDQVAAELMRQFPETGLGYAIFHEGLDQPRCYDAQGRPDPQPEFDGVHVLVLGDLGALGGPAAERPWLRFGRQVVAAGGWPAALLPCRANRVADALRRDWALLPWEAMPANETDAGQVPQSERQAQVERLLTLLSPAVRIEPGLLRALRLALQEPGMDAAIESEVWQHSAIASTHCEAATLNPAQVEALREAFPERSLQRQKQALALIRLWHGHLPPEIWFEEVLSLAAEARDALPEPQDLADARSFYDYICAEMGTAPEGIQGLRPFMRRMAGRARAANSPIWRDEVLGQSLLRLDWDMNGGRPGYQAPTAVDPSRLPAPERVPVTLALAQQGIRLQAQLFDAPSSAPGSACGLLRTRNRQLEVLGGDGRPSHVAQAGAGFFEGGQPPAWADAWGWDSYGAWVEFSLQGSDGTKVSQRLRWMEPGSFLMGSPADELERYGDEGPQHPVHLGEGFWLADTACTQALWQAVMGDRPSSFEGEQLPVEQVGWNDVQRFITALNQRLPGLGLQLPSEAQWEYACRAGTDTPFSFGGNITPEQVNYDGRASYAGGEKGLYRGKTIAVRDLPPNAWGLHQMHGNVWEWVEDAWHGNYRGAPRDGSAWDAGQVGADRVVRGGAWGDVAGNCRSAFRGRDSPGLRFYILGFRLARVQGREAGRAGEGRVAPVRPGPRSGSGRAGPGTSRPAAGQGSMVGLRLDRTAELISELPTDDRRLILRSDLDELRLRRIERPDWASAMGRDRYGLWAQVELNKAQTGAPVAMRLRWIPPGRFVMGSPGDEPGRWEYEGPAHPVVIGRGFWLAETPCTQAQWEAVLSSNPSHFVDPQRPVEQVSWNDLRQGFLPALNERIPGFVLPSEAQWEYACRAGTQTALYSGAIEILGRNNAPALDAIAWYGGNSGRDYDLEVALETTGELWREMQYPTSRAGTRKVGLKQANPWGLYDMLGNVWEWTEDAWKDSYDGAAADGSVRQGEGDGAGRVIRGGAWLSGARYCRSACRSRDSAGRRLSVLGFRLARVQES